MAVVQTVGKASVLPLDLGADTVVTEESNVSILLAEEWYKNGEQVHTKRR